MDSAALADTHLTLLPICAFLWRFTFAAVPKPLRVTLVTVVHDAGMRLAREVSRVGSGVTREGPTVKMMKTAIAVKCVLDSDVTYRAWLRTAEGRAAPVSPALQKGRKEEWRDTVRCELPHSAPRQSRSREVDGTRGVLYAAALHALAP